MKRLIAASMGTIFSIGALIMPAYAQTNVLPEHRVDTGWIAYNVNPGNGVHNTGYSFATSTGGDITVTWTQYGVHTGQKANMTWEIIDMDNGDVVDTKTVTSDAKTVPYPSMSVSGVSSGAYEVIGMDNNSYEVQGAYDISYTTGN